MSQERNWYRLYSKPNNMMGGLQSLPCYTVYDLKSSAQKSGGLGDSLVQIARLAVEHRAPVRVAQSRVKESSAAIVLSI